MRQTGVREANLSHVLRLVHLHGPISRAVITARTGLNRSTVGDLVTELTVAGLVLEGEPAAHGRVGRPSPVVAADVRPVVVAANPEVDALTLAAVGLDRGIRARIRIARDELLTPEETADLIAVQIAAWRDGPLADARVLSIGVAVPGPVRAADGLVRAAPHLGWVDAALGPLITEATELPVVVGNDANLGAVAEHLFGAARGVDDVVYLNGGASGIGGAIIAGGHPLTGAGGYAGEFGQSRPAVASEDDRRSEVGTLEDEVSRRRLLAAVSLRSADEAELAAALATSADPAVADEVTRQRRILATALANAVNGLNPSVLVLGGFLATLAARDLPGLLTDVRAQSMPTSGEGIDIRLATLADDRLLIGAAEAALSELLHDPIATLAR
ncbi:ROK family transcriptional regulator [Microbacterium horticulturae]|uniref:ROK family transcriptional regulator n=1 Tax=Microbacterium horticulturae TaxID=3028316 RepID=A0ABY8BXD6_9MICO|nr:ROK family transcriptional regulator [Microbacterium sp. KACC 23027]WEG08834.1 ROK family transcriptional regulator [Microbacterium sp. KACC 23027]